MLHLGISLNLDPVYSSIAKFQEKTAKQVIIQDEFTIPIRNVCGVDVAYRNDTGFCSAVVINKNSFEIIESVNLKCKVNYPYIPGLFLLREFEPIIKTVSLLKEEFDLLLVDGHGQLHPRRCGLACSVGLALSKPTIGIAKRLLCGTLKGNLVELDGQVLGIKLEKNSKNPLYVSVGHKISLKTAEKIVEELIRESKSAPFPLLVAHRNSKRFSKERFRIFLV